MRYEFKKPYFFKTKKEALAFAIKFMKTHPRG